jgi:hypothetical protein
VTLRLRDENVPGGRSSPRVPLGTASCAIPRPAMIGWRTRPREQMLTAPSLHRRSNAWFGHL